MSSRNQQLAEAGESLQKEVEDLKAHLEAVSSSEQDLKEELQLRIIEEVREKPMVKYCLRSWFFSF